MKLSSPLVPEQRRHEKQILYYLTPRVAKRLIDYIVTSRDWKFEGGGEKY